MFLKLLQRTTEISFSYFEYNPGLICSVESVEACVRWTRMQMWLRMPSLPRHSLLSECHMVLMVYTVEFHLCI